MGWIAWPANWFSRSHVEPFTCSPLHWPESWHQSRWLMSGWLAVVKHFHTLLFHTCWLDYLNKEFSIYIFISSRNNVRTMLGSFIMMQIFKGISFVILSFQKRLEECSILSKGKKRKTWWGGELTISVICLSGFNSKHIL